MKCRSTLKLTHPAFISSRLLPAVRAGNAIISMQREGRDDEGRDVFRYWIEFASDAGDRTEYEAADLRSGVGGCSLQEAFASLLCFLEAAAEAYACEVRAGRASDNDDMFPHEINEWAYLNSDEIGDKRFELDDCAGAIEEL